MSTHSLNCDAPICQDDCGDDLVWYAGEKVCTKKPFTKWQSKQTMINNYIKKHTLSSMDVPRNVLSLKHLSI